MKKILYIGAGLDLNPIKHFPDINEFVFVDTLPSTEYDTDNFIPDLTHSAKTLGFDFEYIKETDFKYFTSIMTITQRIKWIGRVLETFPQINPSVAVFYNYKTSQELKYYLSTNILRNISSKLLEDIESSTKLVVSGYHPDKLILELISKPISLYGYTNTKYNIKPEEQDNPDNMFAKLFGNPLLVDHYFDKIYRIGSESGYIIRCDNLFGLDNSDKLDKIDELEELDD